jgi:hypothetical protein
MFEQLYHAQKNFLRGKVGVMEIPPTFSHLFVKRRWGRRSLRSGAMLLIKVRILLVV